MIEGGGEGAYGDLAYRYVTTDYTGGILQKFN